MEKLNVNRCGVEPDDGIFHLWSSTPTIEITELGPVAWWLCGRCPARVLHDSETEDGFPAEPIVVYPSSCFDPAPRCGEKHESFVDMSCMRSAGHAGEHCPIETCPRHPDDGSCGCPRRAAGDVVHLEGCVERDVQTEVEGGLLLRTTEAPEPPIIVHPPTDPTPPSDELTRAIENADDDIPTQRYPVVETGPSVFERIERLFGRPITGDAR